VTVTAHATRRELISDYEPWFGAMEIPGHAGALMELKLGQAGHDAMGFVVHVPHYLARIEYPESARGLLEHLARSSGLSLPVEVDKQVAGSQESMSVVAGLEARFDSIIGGSDQRPLLSTDAGPLPTGDEIAAELEQFLAEQERGGAES
jgi:hypothetical protein